MADNADAEPGIQGGDLVLSATSHRADHGAAPAPGHHEQGGAHRAPRKGLLARLLHKG
ncbi:hypothetical protein GCM10022237_29150 [Nocardioides ginsengisoli]|uniref:Uncharacterized protein n=1 Tax=Nocardioides ginsengisoli TaxID=363868 RepID=A0ABW3W5X7_9ACTN